MSRQLIAISATLLLVSACADPEAGEPIYVIVLPDEDQPAAPDMADAPDQEQPDQEQPDLAAPDMSAPDQGQPEDMASPPDMDLPDQGKRTWRPTRPTPARAG